MHHLVPYERVILDIYFLVVVLIYLFFLYFIALTSEIACLDPSFGTSCHLEMLTYLGTAGPAWLLT